ncbi:efflux RND transporter periplasmic adaptor subunit [Marinobacter bryozoorum]|uniref:efflux RND transporter periplasmic adaptor subunit n=1 Tax=Marinobacter bryozoorum TaxID=256324 RepID=UPI0020048457|nr:efflux RND transporter periplasmic adaptor subunit [Marinobacter bryozoorum]MCK7545678.1 efflux RND transporter periplasmic adaptor subunit [Marinobacter bryozoorum]
MATPVTGGWYKRLGGFLLLVLVIGALVAGWWYASRPAAQPSLLTVAVERGDLEDLVTATGVLQPRDYVDVGAQVSGQLEVIHVDTGDQVRKGDLLAEIDPTVYTARVDATRAQLRNQKAQLMEREAQLTLAQIQHRRQQNLLKEEATSREAAQVAEATLRSARAQIEAISAQIQQTESTLRAEEANLEYARIYAPMDGTVVSIEARQGQTLNTNQQAPVLMRIADLSTMTVEAQVSEADIGKLRTGMPVYFTTLGSQQRRWESTLDRLEPTPTVENNVVLYNAVFEVPNAEGRLMTQMTAQVFFINNAARDALLVPVTALQQRGPQATVQVVGDDGEPRERQVTVGVTNRVQAEILDGLEEGERIVSSPRSAGGQGDDSRARRMVGMRF